MARVSHGLDRVGVSFDDPNLVANAGLILVSTLALPARLELRFAKWRIVTAGYFQTVGIPILSGRSCRMTTDPAAPFEALVNRTFAERYFWGRDPIGHEILKGPQGNLPARVVGVVADAREDGRGALPESLIYACGFLRYWPDSDFLIQARNVHQVWPGLAG